MKAAKIVVILLVAYAVLGERAAYRATPATEPEHDAFGGAHPLGLGIRVLTGFPPRYFPPLDPK